MLVCNLLIELFFNIISVLNLITFENVIGKLFISFVAKTHPSATPSQSGNTPPAAMGLLFNIPVNDIPISFR